MKSRNLIAALLLWVVGTACQAAAQFSEKDYSLYAGDFNGDGHSDLLYVGKTPDKPNGIALSDPNGVPQVGFQSWPATHWGIPWSTGQFVPAIGDFNGDGKSDVLMQAATAGTSYVLLANANAALAPIGQLVGIHQGISNTAFGMTWSADQHKLLVGDFDGDGKDDVLLQATTKGGTNAIVLSDSGGNLFTRSSSYCWSGGPQQCWTDGEQGLDWSTKSAVLTVGRFNLDARADLLYQPRPNIVLIDYDIPIPVPTFKPNTFGIFLGQLPDGSGRIIRTPNQLWSHTDLGGGWSPLNGTAYVGDFNADGTMDILLQSRNGSNLLFYANGSGVVGSAVTPPGNLASWNGSSYNLIVGRFGNSAGASLYLQAKDETGDNYYTSDLSGASVSASVSDLQIRATLPTAPTAIGATPATADVTQNGSAAYTIPIQLPRGTAGLTPELSLTYNSSSGNGLVGVGWNLTGLGIIARCPRTLAQDGEARGVELLANDQYCLNGNRLRKVAGNQGQAGSVYRTELETYARVTAMGGDSTGPQWWKVETKDGLTYEYGESASSRIPVPGNSVTRVWALSKVRDRASNYWTATYTYESGAYRPDRIDYTANSAQGTTSMYRVSFEYETRNTSEYVVSYYGGGLINQTKRLSAIEYQSTSGAGSVGTMRRRYALTYHPSTTSFNVVSRLASVQECVPSTACMAATTFEWSDQALNGGQLTFGTPTAVAAINAGEDPNYGGASHAILDINGDGVLDAVVQSTSIAGSSSGACGPTPCGPAVVRLGARRGQTNPPEISVASTDDYFVGSTAYDWNADGKDDVIGGSRLMQHVSGSTFSYGNTSSYAQGGDLQIDVDGDGFKDAVYIRCGIHNRVDVQFHSRSSIEGLEANIETAWSGSSNGEQIACTNVSIPYGQDPSSGSILQHDVRRKIVAPGIDIDGDGHNDIIVQVGTGWRVLYSTGTGFASGELLQTSQDYIYSLSNGQITSFSPPLALDVNGDGCTDVVYKSSGGGKLMTSRCRRVPGVSTSLNAPISIVPTGIGDGLEVQAFDANLDGYQDLVTAGNVWLSTGVAFRSASAVSAGAAPGSAWNASLYVGDYDGDTLPDATWLCPPEELNSMYWNQWAGPYTMCSHAGLQFHPSVGDRPNLLMRATDGFGKRVEFTYAPTVDPAIYTRGTTGIGKAQDTQGSMYVVRTMTLSDGIGSYYTQSYVYSGAKRHIAGRGFLGFSAREVTDSRTGFVTREVFNNTVAADGSQWEYVGTLASRSVHQFKDGATYGPKVEELTQDWHAILPDDAPNRRYPYVQTSVQRRYELGSSGAPITSATTTTTLDNYGTPFNVVTVTKEGEPDGQGPSATIQSFSPFILNNEATWCLSRPQRVEDTRSHTMTGGGQITRVSTQVWDADLCRVTHTTVAPESSHKLETDFEYDDFNNVKKTTVTGSGITSPIITQADFGANGHLQLSATNAKGHVTQFTWNVNLGFRTSITDPNNQTTTFFPDEFGREKEMIRPDGTRTFKTYFNCTASNSYCGDGLVRYVVRTEERTVTNAMVNYADQFQDVMGRVKYVQSLGYGGQTVVTETLYDNRGNVALKTNPHYAGSGSVSGVSMTYDSLNRLFMTQRPISDTDRTVVTESVVYEGLKVRTFDAKGRETFKILNVLGSVAQATEVVEEGNRNTTYTYNAFGELLSAADPAGNTSTIHYIAERGFKDSSDDPDMGHWTYTYDALGQMLSQTDAKEQTTHFTYDELGRLKKRTDYPGTAADETHWTWDGPNGQGTIYNRGQLYSVISPGGYSETYIYDDKARRSQLTVGTNSGSFVMDYGYDVTLGALRNVTYPVSTAGSRVSVQYSYQNGFLKDARDASAGMALLWQANAQDPRGHVTQESYGNGQTTTLGFDQTNGRLNTIQTGASEAIQNLTYGWDAIGNLVSRRDNTQGITETFEYDMAYRLTNVRRNGDLTQSMTYDAIGNITSKLGVGTYTYGNAQAACSYNATQPHAVRTAGTNVYCYDQNGNMVSRSGATVIWSAYNYPLTINQAGGNTSTFEYGADRNRYREVSVDGAVTEDKLTVAGGAFEKVIRDGTIQYRHYVSAGDKVVAIITRKATAVQPTEPTEVDVLYLHSDHLGSTDVITDGSGAVAMRTSFDAWGMRRSSNWTGLPSAADKAAIAAATRKGYTGHEQLDNLNLVHMNGRVYDPLIARFMSADPIIQDPYHSQAFNRYSYVWNNPLNATDPTGFCKVTGSHIEYANCFEWRTGVEPNLNDTGQSQGATTTPNPTSNQTGGNNSAQVVDNSYDSSRLKQDENREQSPAQMRRTVEREWKNMQATMMRRQRDAEKKGDSASAEEFAAALTMLKETPISFHGNWPVVGHEDGEYQVAHKNALEPILDAEGNEVGKKVVSYGIDFNLERMARIFVTGGQPKNSEDGYYADTSPGVRGVREQIAHDLRHGMLANHLRRDGNEMSPKEREKDADDWSMKVFPR